MAAFNNSRGTVPVPGINKKLERCGICEKCQLPDCGVCNYCRYNKRTTEGSGLVTLPCKERQCLQIKKFKDEFKTQQLRMVLEQSNSQVPVDTYIKQPNMTVPTNATRPPDPTKSTDIQQSMPRMVSEWVRGPPQGPPQEVKGISQENSYDERGRIIVKDASSIAIKRDNLQDDPIRKKELMQRLTVDVNIKYCAFCGKQHSECKCLNSNTAKPQGDPEDEVSLTPTNFLMLRKLNRNTAVHVIHEAIKNVCPIPIRSILRNQDPVTQAFTGTCYVEVHNPIVAVMMYDILIKKQLIINGHKALVSYWKVPATVSGPNKSVASPSESVQSQLAWNSNNSLQEPSTIKRTNELQDAAKGTAYMPHERAVTFNSRPSDIIKQSSKPQNTNELPDTGRAIASIPQERVRNANSQPIDINRSSKAQIKPISSGDFSWNVDTPATAKGRCPSDAELSFWNKSRSMASSQVSSIDMSGTLSQYLAHPKSASFNPSPVPKALVPLIPKDFQLTPDNATSLKAWGTVAHGLLATRSSLMSTVQKLQVLSSRHPELAAELPEILDCLRPADKIVVDLIQVCADQFNSAARKGRKAVLQALQDESLENQLVSVPNSATMLFDDAFVERCIVQHFQSDKIQATSIETFQQVCVTGPRPPCPPVISNSSKWHEAKKKRLL